MILAERCHQLLNELGLVTENERITASPLTGGVASDIALVETLNAKYCVKFALPKLKVQADWFAPVHRNAAEYAWLEVAAKITPDSAVTLFGRSKTLHGFAMEFIEGKDTKLWKAELLSGKLPNNEAASVGDLIGRIHGVSAKFGFDATCFQNQDDFHALRIEPYLSFTAERHTDIADIIIQFARELSHSDQVLVHGDVSPKNILVRESGPVILDAECATMGDASFDPSFCLNHLVLKAAHLPICRAKYLKEARSLWDTYARHIHWEPIEELETRICTLLPMLMLARIDGKSPVEYLSQQTQFQVRAIARHFIQIPSSSLKELLEGIETRLENGSQ